MSSKVQVIPSHSVVRTPTESYKIFTVFQRFVVNLLREDVDSLLTTFIPSSIPISSAPIYSFEVTVDMTTLRRQSIPYLSWDCIPYLLWELEGLRGPGRLSRLHRVWRLRLCVGKKGTSETSPTNAPPNVSSQVLSEVRGKSRLGRVSCFGGLLWVHNRTTHRFSSQYTETRKITLKSSPITKCRGSYQEP